MSPELRLRPDALRSHAIIAAGLSEELRGVPPVPAPPGGRALAAEHERLCAAVLLAVRELAELSSVLAGVATAAVAADGHVAEALRHVAEGFDPSGEDGRG